MGTPQEGYGRIALSPDGQTLAAIKTVYAEQGPQRSLATIDLVTGDATEIATSSMPERVAWGPDGTLFYAARQEVKNLLDDLSADARANVIAVLGGDYGIPAYQSSITQIDPATGAETEIYNDYVYTVGRMAWAGDALYFSTVANMDQWIAGIADGSLDITADVDNSAALALVPVTLYTVIPGEEAAIVGHFAQFDLK
jgi:hypothetical protein